MADITQNFAPVAKRADRLGQAVGDWWGRTKIGFRRFIWQMQYARMLSVLSQMTPEQLDEIGITRADIPSHADFLLQREKEELS